MIRVKGVAYPITKNPQGFFHHANTDVDQIKSDMATIILTEPGERIFEPYFGINFKKINLNSPAELVQQDFRLKIATALKKWEKRVQVTDVVVQLNKTEDKQLIVKIQVLFIDPININTTQELILYKSLGGIDGRNLPF